MLLSCRRRRFPFNNRGEVGERIIDAVVGIATLGMVPDVLGIDKKRGGPDASTPPDPNKAAQSALDAQTADRKKLLASGGSTGQGQSSPILGSDIHTLNLGGM